MSKGGSGKGVGAKIAGKGSTPMTGKAASRVQSSAARNPGSPSDASGFAPRAQSAAARNTSDGKSSGSGK
jgi:hypothetical protein